MSSSTVGSGNLRAMLLRAARDEIAESGSAAVSLRAVARRAGVSHAAPAYAFGDRAGVLTAVATQGFHELAAVMDQPAPRGRAGLAELGRRYVDFAGANPALYGVMFRPSELVVADRDLEAARAASLQALTRLTRSDGADAPPGEVTLISWAFAHGAALLAAQGELPLEVVRALIEGFAELAHS